MGSDSQKEGEMMTDREKLAELIADYFGVDPAYFGVDAYEMADHLIGHGVTVSVGEVDFDYSAEDV